MVRDEKLTGLEAAKRILAEAEREEFVSIWLVARALQVSRRRLLKDWTGRLKLPVARIGDERQLPAQLVIETYFRHRLTAQAGLPRETHSDLPT